MNEELFNLITQWEDEGLSEDEIQSRVDSYKAEQEAETEEVEETEEAVEVEKLEPPQTQEEPAVEVEETVSEEPTESESEDGSSESPVASETEVEEVKVDDDSKEDPLSPKNLPFNSKDYELIDILQNEGVSDEEIERQLRSQRQERYDDIPEYIKRPEFMPDNEIDAQAFRDELGKIQTRLRDNIVKDEDIEYLESHGVEVDRSKLTGSVKYYGAGFGTSRVEEGINHDYIDDLLDGAIGYIEKQYGGKSLGNILAEQGENEPQSEFMKFIDYVDQTEGARPYTVGEPGLQVLDFIADNVKAISSGFKRGRTTTTAFNLMKGQNVSPLEIEDYIRDTVELQKDGGSREYQDFQKEYEEGGKDAFSFLKALSKNPTVISEVVVSSLSSLAGSPEALGTAIVAGTTFSPVAGFAAGSAVLETGLSFSEFLQEELDKDGKEFTRENVKAILENEERLNAIKGKAATRGAIIGTVDLLTGKLASSVGSKLLKFSKVRPKYRNTVAATGVITTEGTGGAVGEASARAATGQEQDVAEIGLEFFGEFGPGTVNVATTLAKSNESSYSIGDQPMTKKEMADFINNASSSDLINAEIRVVNDNEFADFVGNKMDVANIDSQIDPKIQGEDRERAILLQKKINDLGDSKTEDAKLKKRELKAALKQISEDNGVTAPQSNTANTDRKENNAINEVDKEIKENKESQSKVEGFSPDALIETITEKVDETTSEQVETTEDTEATTETPDTTTETKQTETEVKPETQEQEVISEEGEVEKFSQFQLDKLNKPLGKKVNIPGFEEYNFHIEKDGKSYDIREGSTGITLGLRESNGASPRTQKKAIELAKQRLSKEGKAKLDNAIKDTLKRIPDGKTNVLIDEGTTDIKPADGVSAPNVQQREGGSGITPEQGQIRTAEGPVNPNTGEGLQNVLSNNGVNATGKSVVGDTEQISKGRSKLGKLEGTFLDSKWSDNVVVAYASDNDILKHAPGQINAKAFVISTDNKAPVVVINTDKVESGDKVHEYTHLWDDALSLDKEGRSIQSEGRKLLEKSPEYLNPQIERIQKGYDIEEFSPEWWNEATAGAVQQRFNEIQSGESNANSKEIDSWIKRVFDYLSKKLGLKRFSNAGEYLDSAINDILAGEDADTRLAKNVKSGKTGTVAIKNRGLGSKSVVSESRIESQPSDKKRERMKLDNVVTDNLPALDKLSNESYINSTIPEPKRVLNPKQIKELKATEEEVKLERSSFIEKIGGWKPKIRSNRAGYSLLNDENVSSERVYDAIAFALQSAFDKKHMDKIENRRAKFTTYQDFGNKLIQGLNVQGLKDRFDVEYTQDQKKLQSVRL